MRPRLSDVVAFVVGATIAIVMSLFYDTGSFYDDAPVFPSIVLRFLCPGFLLGSPLAAPFTSGMGLDGLGFTILVMALVNGLLFGLAWYFGGIAAKGSRVAVLVIVLAVGLWTVVYARWCGKHWPKHVPVMPVDFSSPLAGRWEGVIHGARRDVPVILVCHPRTDGTLDGTFYEAGHMSGRFYRGGFVGDSVYFDAGGWEHRGHRDGMQMTFESWTVGRNEMMEVRFVSADTTRLALPPLISDE